MRGHIGSVLWACTDCLMVSANGEAEGAPADHGERYAVGVEREVNGYGHLVPGLPGGCAHPDQEDPETGSECDCDYDAFSRAACQVCGEPLAGERHALTVITV